MSKQKRNTTVTETAKTVVAVVETPTVATETTETPTVATETYVKPNVSVTPVTKVHIPSVPAGQRAFNPAQGITMLVGSNPKQPGSASAARFALYFAMPVGFTVGDYVKALKASGIKGCNYAAQDVVWDARHGFIRVEAMQLPAVVPPVV